MSAKADTSIIYFLGNFGPNIDPKAASAFAAELALTEDDYAVEGLLLMILILPKRLMPLM